MELPDPKCSGAPITGRERGIEILANALTRIHGPINARRERGGIQLYMACPVCLQTHGREELADKKLSVNPELFLRLGEYADKSVEDADWAGWCMRHSIDKIRDRLSVNALLAMLPIQQRGYPQVRGRVSNAAAQLCLIDDGHGNRIPDHPGTVVPLPDLPTTHPAVTYLTHRGFSIAALYAQFRVSFCTQEAPVDYDRGRAYRVLSGDFKDTPQHRIIFYADMHGVQRGWQARIIDTVVGDVKYYLHPYTGQWVAMEQGRDPVTGKWLLLPHVAETGKWSSLSKYKTAFSSRRNEMLMGLDAALAWNAQHRLGMPRLIILTEGPLDAGRFGPPGCPLMGKYFSEQQLNHIYALFGLVLYAGQNDAASTKLGENINENARGFGLERISLKYTKPGRYDVDVVATPWCRTQRGRLSARSQGTRLKLSVLPSCLPWGLHLASDVVELGECEIHDLEARILNWPPIAHDGTNRALARRIKRQHALGHLPEQFDPHLDMKKIPDPLRDGCEHLAAVARAPRAWCIGESDWIAAEIRGFAFQAGDTNLILLMTEPAAQFSIPADSANLRVRLSHLRYVPGTGTPRGCRRHRILPKGMHAVSPRTGLAPPQHPAEADACGLPEPGFDIGAESAQNAEGYCRGFSRRTPAR